MKKKRSTRRARTVAAGGRSGAHAARRGSVLWLLLLVSGGCSGGVFDDESTQSASTDQGNDSTGSDSLPDSDYCAEVQTWGESWVRWEDEVLELVNQERRQGASCGSAGNFAPSDPLTMSAALRCAARVHSLDMFERDFFDHTNPDGESPFDRMERAGYEGGSAGENIAQGYQGPEEAVDGWMSSDGHCANIMNEAFTSIGVGYHEGEVITTRGGTERSEHLWTQTFGGPPRDFGRRGN